MHIYLLCRFVIQLIIKKEKMKFKFEESKEYQKELIKIFDKGLSEMSECMEIVKLGNKYRKIEKEKSLREEREKIESCEEFVLYLQFNEKRSNGLYLEEIKLNGIRNARMISNQYKLIGNNINLYRLSLKALIDGKEKKIMGVKFN